MNHEERCAKEREEHEALYPRLQEAGYEPIYGGGTASKGHGYWLNVFNDGENSGNPHFWMYADALALLEEGRALATLPDVFAGGVRYGLHLAARRCQAELEDTLHLWRDAQRGMPR